VATAFRDGTRVIGDLRKTGAIDPAAAETLLKALTTLFVQAIILHLTEALFEPDGAIGVLRHSLVEESRR